MLQNFLSIFKMDSLLAIHNYVSQNANFEKEYFDFSKNTAAHIATHNFGLPTFESGAQKILNKVFPSINGKTFKLSTLTRQEVLDNDDTELKVYARTKSFDIKNPSILVLTCNYIKDKIINLGDTISIKEAVETLPQTSSAGFPNYGKKGSKSNISFCCSSILEFFSIKDMYSKFDYIRQFPTTVFHRFSTKIKKKGDTYRPDYKIRQVLATPYFIVAIEKYLFYNFVKSFSASFPSYTVNLRKKEISTKIQKLRFNARNLDSYILCGDIKGNDKSISMEHSSLFFQIASHFIDPKLMSSFNAIFIYYLRTPMLYSKGILYSSGSTISGSWLTSCFTTLTVLIALQYSFYKIYNRFAKDDEYLIQGDDFVVILKSVDDSILLKEFMLELNLRLRLDTSGLVLWYNKIEYLGYFWSSSGEPDQTDEWIIGKILYPKGFVRINGPLRIIYRIISIIINLFRFRELFTLFRKFDKMLDLLFLRNNNPVFEMITNDNTLMKVKIPFEKLWRFGWTCL